jgi:PAS domain S-box-containing protein
MATNPQQEAAKRILLAAPTAKDGQITRALLVRAGLACVVCRSLCGLAREIEAGAGAVLLTEDAITADGIDELLATLKKQPTWSDLPVVMMMQGGILSPVAARVLRLLRNVTLLERPAPTRSVVSAMQSAVRARERQYQIREQIETIRRGQERMSRIMESNVMGVSFCGAQRIVEANDAFLKIIGYSREELETGQLNWRRITPGEYSHLDDRAIEELANCGTCTPFEKEYVRKNGTRVPVLLRIASLEENESKFVCFVQDLTGQKEAERERSALLSSERAARSEAERAGRMKDEFLATLSHELRTPLNAILGWSQVMRQGKMNAQDLQEGLDVIERNARVQTQLIEDLLDMSRIISGKVRLDVQTVEPISFIEAAIETMRPAAQAKDIKLEKRLDSATGPISGDPSRLQQVVWNLIANAVKFTPRGGKVQILLDKVNSHVQITVADTGIGISPQLLPHVFERFRQADASTTRRYGGLGLGLSIVKHLVELHGGGAAVESPGENQGTTFTVRLPITSVRRRPDDGERRQPVVPTTASLPYKTTDLTPLKVVVVDDEADARDLIKRVLEECGAQVLVAGSAADALALVERHKPDILISDIGMPDIDGYELLRRVRALGAARGGRVPAVALTAFARSQDRTRALHAGYLAHLAKPVEPSELIATIATIAGRTGLSVEATTENASLL